MSLKFYYFLLGENMILMQSIPFSCLDVLLNKIYKSKWKTKNSKYLYKDTSLTLGLKKKEQKKVENSGEKARDILPKKNTKHLPSHPYLYWFLN